MSKLDKTELSSAALNSIVEHLEQLKTLQHKSVSLAKKRNRIEKKKLQQSLLDFEQSERQYLIEKSKLQPSFRLTATEVLICEPDFVNDPEQASEAFFLKGQGIGNDHRVLRIRLDAKGSSEYMRPSIVFCDVQNVQHSGLAYAMNETVYFIPIDADNHDKLVERLTVYFVYRDETTLPVVHKYSLNKEANSTLQRWQVVQVNTVYAKTPSAYGLSEDARLETAEQCEALFFDK